ncbi:MAG: DNA/RNA nuclease SfsA [Clostridia bacterium]|nr:DNA/RNA nuclease SfsA [Clostridia bacterium]
MQYGGLLRAYILTTVKSKTARTNFSLFAIKQNRKYILVNLAYANSIVIDNLQRRCFSFLGQRKNIRREVTIDNYRCDILIENTKTILEVKTLYANDQNPVYPTVPSNRVRQQLIKLSSLLDSGYKVCYIFACLNPEVKETNLDFYDDEYKALFKQCLNKGMSCIAISMYFREPPNPICKQIPLLLNL